MKAPLPTHAAITRPAPPTETPAARLLSALIAALRAHLHRPPTDDYLLTPAALQDMGLNASDLMAIRSGRFEADGTRRAR